jgi:hypothetical protein
MDLDMEGDVDTVVNYANESSFRSAQRESTHTV